MFLIFCLHVSFVLVSSHPLYDVNICPITTYPNYGNADQLVVQRSNYNPYIQNILFHNALTPITNTNPQLNTVFVPNYQFHNHNALDILQHVPEPTETPKVINNYILVPEEYLVNDVNENDEVTEHFESSFKNNHKKKCKRRRQKTPASSHHGKKDTNNGEIHFKSKLEESKDEIKSSKDKGKKCKKKRQRNNTGPPSVNIEDTLSKNVFKNEGASEIMKNSAISSVRQNDAEKITSQTERTVTEKSKVPLTESNNKAANEAATGFAEVDVCFDINEECSNLDCRHTRNKDGNIKNKPQSNQQPGLPNNFINYFNSFTPNRQVNPNFFNPNVNFPFNFDYLYHVPKASNFKPKESSNRRRNRKRKQPSPNRQTNSNRKVKDTETTTEHCAKIVELVPEVTEIEISTLATETTTKIEKSIPENVREEIIVDNNESNIEKPIEFDTEAIFIEVSNSNNMPHDNYNDVMDEYYPDFTSDNIYMSSKEDYDPNNFHDRYFYSYGDRTELNRDRRKYEHQKENQLYQNKILNRKQHINKITVPDRREIRENTEVQRKSDASVEKVQFLIPPDPEFPGFRTEMINKEKYFAQNENHRSQANEFSRNKMSSYSDLKEGNRPINNNNVETVFANSKVVKYGQPEKEELKISQPEYKKEIKKNISDEKQTIVIIAKSLDYT